MEVPNKYISNPPPFVYHPELYPELAKNNPEPYTGKTWEPKPKQVNKNPEKLGYSVIKNKNAESENNFTLIDPQILQVNTFNNMVMILFLERKILRLRVL